MFVNLLLALKLMCLFDRFCIGIHTLHKLYLLWSCTKNNRMMWYYTGISACNTWSFISCTLSHSIIKSRGHRISKSFKWNSRLRFPLGTLSWRKPYNLREYPWPLTVAWVSLPQIIEPTTQNLRNLGPTSNQMAAMRDENEGAVWEARYIFTNNGEGCGGQSCVSSCSYVHTGFWSQKSNL